MIRVNIKLRKYVYNTYSSTHQINLVIFNPLTLVFQKDSIWKLWCHLWKRAYGGTNSVLLDQQFSHVCDNVYSWNCTGSNKNVHCICSSAIYIVGSDQTPLITGTIWPGLTLFVPPLGRFSQMMSHLSLSSGPVSDVFSLFRWTTLRVTSAAISAVSSRC